MCVNLCLVGVPIIYIYIYTYKFIYISESHGYFHMKYEIIYLNEKVYLINLHL